MLRKNTPRNYDRGETNLEEKVCRLNLTRQIIATKRQTVRSSLNFYISDNLTLEQIAAANHLLISPYGPIRDLIDHALHLQGYSRNIQTIVPSLFAALSIVESSDLVVTLPERVARNNARRFEITHKSLPIEGGAFRMHAVRHNRDANNPLHRWLIEKLLGVITD